MPVLQNTTADKTRLIANFNYEQAYQIQHQAIFLKCNLRLLTLKNTRLLPTTMLICYQN